MNVTKRLATALVMLGACAAIVSALAASGLEVRDAWVKPTVPGQSVAAAYMTLYSPTALRVVAIRSNVSSAAEIHTMSVENGIMRMRQVDTLAIPARKAVALAPGADASHACRFAATAQGRRCRRIGVHNRGRRGSKGVNPDSGAGAAGACPMRRFHRFVPGVWWIVAPFLVLALAACGRSAPQEKFQASDITGVAWGRDFHLVDPAGTPRSLADYRGKVVMLFFGYTNCPDACPTATGEDGAGCRSTRRRRSACSGIVRDGGSSPRHGGGSQAVCARLPPDLRRPPGGPADDSNHGQGLQGVL